MCEFTISFTSRTVFQKKIHFIFCKKNVVFTIFNFNTEIVFYFN